MSFVDLYGTSGLGVPNFEIQAANPQGVPQAVNQPGGAPYTIQGATLFGGSTGNPVTTGQGATAAPNTVATNPQGNTAPTPTAAQSSSSVTPGSIADYFARGVIIVLGFIFVAEGLKMLGITKMSPVQTIRNAAG